MRLLIDVSYIFVSVILISFTVGASGTTVMEQFWNVPQYFDQKLKSNVTPNSVAELNLIEDTPSPVEFHRKMHLGTFHAKFGYRNCYMAPCENKEDCDAGIRMICEQKKCICRTGELFFEWPKFGCFIKASIFERCEVSGQCMAMNSNTYCNPENGRCTCSPNYFYNGHECSLRYDTVNIKAQEVYKAAVVAAACFIVAVVGIFVVCIVRRSFCRRHQQLQQSESNRNSDIFTISDEIAALRAVDKPPSYEEVLQIERTFYGIPPPEYSEPRSVMSTASSQLSTTSNTALIPDVINPSCNPEYHSAAVASSSTCSSPSESTKNCSTHAASLGKDLTGNLHLQTANMSDFVTAAEVLPVPSDGENSSLNMSPSFSGTSSHNAHFHHYSSTPPPPRLHRHFAKSNHGSSSLPSSPYLSSFSPKFGTDFVNSHAISRKKLLKQDSDDTQPDSSHFSQNASSETSSVVSMPHEISTTSNATNFEHSVTVIAYDNLGFESDLYL